MHQNLKTMHISAELFGVRRAPKASGSLQSHLKNLVLSATVTSVRPEVVPCRPWPLPRQQDREMRRPVPLLPHVMQEQTVVLLSARLQNGFCVTPSHGLHDGSDHPLASQHFFSLNCLSPNHLFLVPIRPHHHPPTPSTYEETRV